jgi:MGT family glycosyltransferase
MSRFLLYAAPGSGHLFPLIATAEELRRRGHEPLVRADSSGVRTLRSLGFSAEPIRRLIEEREDDTWRAKTPLGGMRRSVQMYLDRFDHELADVRDAIQAERPDAVMVDSNAWGAAAAAEASGLPWAQAATFLLPLITSDAPPFGLGLAPARGPLGRARDALIRGAALPLFDRLLPAVNARRQAAGVAAVEHLPDLYVLAPLVVAYYAEPLEYPRRHMPANVRLVGPASWEPPVEGDVPLPATRERPTILVTASTQYQNDKRLIEVTLEALADEPLQVIATTASLDPEGFRVPNNAYVVRFLPHGAVLRQSACVVCHGGMGITGKALLSGVPMCIVPFGRDQFETARRVVVGQAGTSLPAFRLNPRRLRAAVHEALERRPGAERAGRMLRAAGGAGAAADALESLLGAPSAQAPSAIRA